MFSFSQLEDTNIDETSEEIALQLAAQGVIGKRVDEMESGFMMALDYMIQTAEKDQDDKVHLHFQFSTFSFDMKLYFYYCFFSGISKLKFSVKMKVRYKNACSEMITN